MKGHGVRFLRHSTLADPLRGGQINLPQVLHRGHHSIDTVIDDCCIESNQHNNQPL